MGPGDGFLAYGGSRNLNLATSSQVTFRAIPTREEPGSALVGDPAKNSENVFHTLHEVFLAFRKQGLPRDFQSSRKYFQDFTKGFLRFTKGL